LAGVWVGTPCGVGTSAWAGVWEECGACLAWAGAWAECGECPAGAGEHQAGVGALPDGVHPAGAVKEAVKS
jgi:hypothetical protein